MIALIHMLPDAWTAATTAGMPQWLVPAVAVVSFVMTIAVSRIGCTCQADEEHASGA